MQNVKKEIKSICQTRNLIDALNKIYLQLEKRTWQAYGRNYMLMGINKNTMCAMFSCWESAEVGSAVNYRLNIPVIDALECLSGQL